MRHHVRLFLVLVVSLFALVGTLSTPSTSMAEETNIADHIVLRSAELNTMWSDVFTSLGGTHATPSVIVILPADQARYEGQYSDNVWLLTEPVASTWGDKSSWDGSFYDFYTQTIYLSYSDIASQWQYYGDFAVSFLIAHEWGHHISNQLYYPDFGSLYGVGPQNQTFFELQADCYVGIYANWVGAWDALEVGDVDEAYSWAGSIGDDVLTGNTDSSTWTHGSGAQRAASFWHGYSTNQCDAYSGLNGNTPTTSIQNCDTVIQGACTTADTGSQVWAAGWYDPYGYGCLYWYDGTQYTEYVDCDGDGYSDTTNSSVGWYGPYDDGCNYWWDGTQWNGQVDCNGDGLADTVATDSSADCQNPIAVPCEEQGNMGGNEYTAGWYGPYDDGCNYWWDGTQWTGHVDCNGDGYAD